MSIDQLLTRGDAPPSGAEPHKPAPLERIAAELQRLDKMQATGELAALRRMDRASVPPAGFYRVMARAGFTELNAESVRRWAAIVHIMAQRPDALRPGSLGESLAKIGLSEQRLDMLLNARGATLLDLARRTALRLTRSDEAMPYRDLCDLVRLDGRAEKEQEAEDLRIRIAQSFQRAARGNPTGSDASKA